MKYFRVSLVASLAVALMAFGMPWLLRSSAFTTSLKMCLLLAFLWGTLLAFALVRFKKRGFWFLVGAPPALYWSFVYTWVLWNCSHDFKPLCG